MPKPPPLTLLLALALILPTPASTRAATPSASSGGPVGALLASLLSGTAADESSVLQMSLKASNEEWSIIYPKLQQVIALRAMVQADGPTAAAADDSFGRRILNAPLGGTSMDAPNMAGSSRGRYNRGNPFDPARAPGSPSRVNTSAGLGGAITRGLGHSVKTGQGNSVQILLTELQALLDDKTTSDKQLFDKLAAIRAARTKAARDLDAARQDLLPLLTTDQLAVLVTLGYMD